MDSDVIANVYKNQVPSFTIHKKYSKKHGKKAFQLTLENIRNMILWLLTDQSTKPSWIQFSNIPIIETVMVVVVDSNQPLYKNYKQTKFVILPIKRTSGPSTWCNHILYKFTASVKRRMDSIDDNEYVKSIQEWTENVDQVKERISSYILDENEMIENDYVIYPENEFSSFIDTETLPFNEKGEKILAVDCEMVITESGFELARVTCVGYNEAVLLDSFVKPEHSVLDYVTKYSGITKENLIDAPSFKEVQQKVLNLLNKDTIIIGHSLENDLKALKLIHHKCIDSAVLFSYIYNVKRKLSYLTMKHLHYVIQNHQDGHDSGEDAIASLRLVYYRAKHSNLKYPNRSTIQVPTDSLLDIVTKNGKRVVYMDDSQQTSFHGRKANMADIINITKGKETICKICLSLSHSKTVPRLIYIRRRRETTPFEEGDTSPEENESNEKQENTSNIDPLDNRNIEELTELLEIFKQHYKNSLFVLVERAKDAYKFGSIYLYMNNGSTETNDTNQSISPTDSDSIQTSHNPETIDLNDM